MAWLIIAGLLNRPITIYGNGKQLRDVLYIDDLVEAYRAVVRRLDSVSGEVLNIGGGSRNTLSPLELLELLTRLLGRAPAVHFEAVRPGDQRVYVSDIRKSQQLLGWKPRTRPEDGVSVLYRWIRANAAVFRQRLSWMGPERLDGATRVAQKKLQVLGERLSHRQLAAGTF